MKKIFLIVFVLNFISCSSSKVSDNEIKMKTNFEDLSVVKTLNLVNSDSITIHELRFYKIDSALDTMKSMYLDYGIWNDQSIGLHQENINQKIWKNIRLFEDDEVYTVIAGGTETKNNYYACLTVYDAKGKDCFDENHPLKNKIIKLFYGRMKENRSKKINYSILKVK
ncbi:hypothetical protein ACFQ3R_08195 [Mesonia ostreae]|uniref:Lipoprotein n=1 Tax=Mesonia ostreae TaxID=861110 RepID=A0ABU2KF93_9FLAO|nr:hypothetical protein [Mesonia ostreae]MDT0293349.1 hypothetical protein [Mesonia ostreae]